MEQPNTIHKKKLKFLDERERVLKRKVSAAEKKLLDVIIEKFIDRLEVSEGQILSNNQNIKLTQALDRIFEDFNSSINKSIILNYVKDIGGLNRLNDRYFSIFEDDSERFANIKTRVENQVKRRLGITDKGNLVRKGFLDGFVKDSRLKNEFKELVTKGITGGGGLQTIKREIRTFVVGNDDRLGSVNSNYQTFIYDTYQQIDRLESGLYAKEIGMESFIYSGGKIATTRDFCCQRNGKIWTVEEAKKWKSLRFQGKTKNYNPLIDLGGYNCRHSTQYISNLVAVRRRDDLELDEDGSLKYKSGVSRQKLNKC